jgi:hypothetical protein
MSFKFEVSSFQPETDEGACAWATRRVGDRRSNRDVKEKSAALSRDAATGGGVRRPPSLGSYGATCKSLIYSTRGCDLGIFCDCKGLIFRRLGRKWHVFWPFPARNHLDFPRVTKKVPVFNFLEKNEQSMSSENVKRAEFTVQSGPPAARTAHSWGQVHGPRNSGGRHSAVASQSGKPRRVYRLVPRGTAWYRIKFFLRDKKSGFHPGPPKIILAFHPAGGKVARESFSEHAVVEAGDVCEDARESNAVAGRGQEAAAGERMHGRNRRGSRGAAGRD